MTSPDRSAISAFPSMFGYSDSATTCPTSIAPATPWSYRPRGRGCQTSYWKRWRPRPPYRINRRRSRARAGLGRRVRVRRPTRRPHRARRRDGANDGPLQRRSAHARRGGIRQCTLRVLARPSYRQVGRPVQPAAGKQGSRQECVNPLTDLPQSVAIVSNSADRLYQFRAPIIRRLLESGIRVYAIAPPGQSISEIESLGAEFVPWPLDRRSVNPISEVRSLAGLVRIYRRLKPDVSQHFTIKPNVYGAIAARLAGVPVVVGGVTGLGYPFAPTGRLRGPLRSFARLLYRLSSALKRPTHL